MILTSRAILLKLKIKQVVDPRFPSGGALTVKVEAATYYFSQFSPKLHGNKKKLDTEGGRVPVNINAVQIVRNVNYCLKNCQSISNERSLKYIYICN